MRDISLVIYKMDRKCKRWTEDEDSVIVSLMSEYPDCRQFAIELAMKKLGRSHASVSCRWYRVLNSRKHAVVVDSAPEVGRKDSFIVRLIRRIFGR